MEQFVAIPSPKLVITKQEFRALEVWERAHSEGPADFTADMADLRATFNGLRGVLAVTIDRTIYSVEFNRVCRFLAIGSEG